MLWNSIATGHRPERHGVHGFAEVDPATNAVRPVSSFSRQCKALWNIVTQAGGRAHMVNWYASHPAEPINGVCVSDALARQTDRGRGSLPPDAIHPPEMAAELSALRMRPGEVDAATLRLFVPLLHEVDPANDRKLVTLAKLISESFTVHRIATRLLQDNPWNLAAIYYPGIDHFSHGFMNFHPPQLRGVSDVNFRLYSEVIMAAYRLHDAFLGRLLALVGPETAVVLLSDHGFHSDHLRPLSIPRSDPVAPAYQHRDHGILVMAGPGVCEGGALHGAGLLDVAPTVLAMLGLPLGRDMPGRVLAEAFREVPKVGFIPSWEQIKGSDGRHPPGMQAASSEDSLVLEHFAALGYLDAQEMQGTFGPEACRRENDWNLAQSLLDGGLLPEGFEILLRLCEQWPERADFAVALAQGLKRIGNTEAAYELIQALVTHNPVSSAAIFLRGVAALDAQRYDEGLDLLRSVEADYDQRAEMHARRGAALLRTGLAAEAREAFARALELDPHDAVGWIGLARCAARRRDWQRVEECALEATRLDFSRPMAHAILGAARLRIGRREEADSALQMACRQAPGWAYPLKLRAFLWKRDPVKSAELRKELDAALQRQERSRARLRTFLTSRHREALQRLNGHYRRVTTSAIGAPSPEGADDGGSFVLVSGLPRSGTSLVMQMLQAGGLPVLTDGRRMADGDNPRGYLEWEPARLLPSRPDLLRQAQGKAVKIVSPLLRFLPRAHHYTVIFVDRPIEEVLASQLKLRAHRGEKSPPDPGRLCEALRMHREASLALLRRSPQVDLLVVPFPELIARPDEWSTRMAAFLALPPMQAAPMAAAVEPELYRNRVA